MPLGVYMSVPFCRTKCSYCNFASDVFSRAVFERYIDRVCEDIDRASATAAAMGGVFENEIDSVYIGGGTPSILEAQQFERLFVTVRRNFRLRQDAEITVECAPGTLTPAFVDTLVRCGVNRVSLGVQSFIDREAAAVGRLHKRETVHSDIARLRSAGIANINVDLIAGLPHQTAESWLFSLNDAISTNVPHVSVYMLEVDEDSRLGKELIAGGTKYHAHFVPNEDEVADFYLTACEQFDAGNLKQYEISNFARAGGESRHNLKYWRRNPYVGFGVDAHSMLKASSPDEDAVRFSTPDVLEQYVAGTPVRRIPVSPEQAVEENFFLGLRLNSGVDLRQLTARFGQDVVAAQNPAIEESINNELVEREGAVIRLTRRGRLLSNDVFERFVGVSAS